MTVLEQATALFPQTATVVIAGADNPALVNLAWDLGARLVLYPPQISELLPDVVAGFLGGPV
jgi:hypothetical protein